MINFKKVIEVHHPMCEWNCGNEAVYKVDGDYMCDDCANDWVDERVERELGDSQSSECNNCGVDDEALYETDGYDMLCYNCYEDYLRDKYNDELKDITEQDIKKYNNIVDK